MRFLSVDCVWLPPRKVEEEWLEDEVDVMEADDEEGEDAFE